jgi:hypothetical protein
MHSTGSTSFGVGIPLFGDLYQCGYHCLQIDTGVNLHNGFNHHLSKHCGDPFRAGPIRVVLKAKARPMRHRQVEEEGEMR